MGFVATHVIPSLEYAAVVVVCAMATKRPIVGLHATEIQSTALGRGFVATHVIPSFEYAALVVLKATETNRPVAVFTVIARHNCELGIVEATHVIPSFEYAAAVEL
jgi:hypothetical protein